MRRILTIDGGGLKGALPAAFLAAVEEQLNHPLADHFDLIAGTSTGAIIALGLGMGLSAQQILEFYVKHGPSIFQQEVLGSSVAHWLLRTAELFGRSVRRWVVEKYDPRRLKIALDHTFGAKLLGHSRSRLVIPAFDSVRREVHVFKTAHHPRLRYDYKIPAVNVALSTSAAPTYLPAHVLDSGVTLLDGGVWANNPTCVAAVEAIGVLEWPRDDLYILSLGCSEEVTALPDNGGLLGVGRAVVDLLFVGQSRSSVGMARLLVGEKQPGSRVFRYESSVPAGRYALDSATHLSELRGLGAAAARDAFHHIEPVFFRDIAEAFVPCYMVQ